MGAIGCHARVGEHLLCLEKIVPRVKEIPVFTGMTVLNEINSATKATMAVVGYFISVGAYLGLGDGALLD